MNYIRIQLRLILIKLLSEYMKLKIPWDKLELKDGKLVYKGNLDDFYTDEEIKVVE